MIKEIYNSDDVLIRTEEATPTCGEDFCDYCGDCLACYGADDCLHSHDNNHGWVVYEDKADIAAEQEEYIGYNHITGLTYCAVCGAEWEAFRGGTEWHENDCLIVDNMEGGYEQFNLPGAW